MMSKRAKQIVEAQTLTAKQALNTCFTTCRDQGVSPPVLAMAYVCEAATHVAAMAVLSGDTTRGESLLRELHDLLDRQFAVFVKRNTH